MSRLRLSCASAIFALSLAACGGASQTPEAAEGEGQAAETTAPRGPELAAEITALLSQARACNSAAYSSPTFEMPERDENTADADFNALTSQLFLDANAQQPCVFSTPSGLQFLIRKGSNSGQSPVSGEMVRVHYHGQLIDGTVFDSSYERLVAAEFPSNRLISGWVEALPMMREGEAWTLFISPELGYGTRGTPGGPIGPNQALVFNLELLGLPGREQGQ